MADPRVTKMAKVLVHYSLELKPGQQFLLRTSPLAEELAVEVYREAVQAGAHVTTQISLPGMDEVFFKHASDEQLDYISPVIQMITETFDARMYIDAEYNSRELSGVDPKRMARQRKAYAPLSKIFMQRAASGALRWVSTAYPTHAMAQDADMSLHDYREFVFGAGMLNEDDPVAFWRAEGEKQKQLVGWLAGRDQVVMKGSNIDLRMSIKDRSFVTADGKYNFPDGEIFTGPVEDSAEGWIRFRYPAIYSGQEITDIELWFEKGKVVKEQASKNGALLTALLDTDAGARFLGELGIGTNYGIQRFTKNMLFDEKIGGTFHLAVGASYPETGGRNESGVHWDMLCDMNDAEVHVDGDLFYKNGKPVI